jgi:hypothetical protein
MRELVSFESQCVMGLWCEGVTNSRFIGVRGYTMFKS